MFKITENSLPEVPHGSSFSALTETQKPPSRSPLSRWLWLTLAAFVVLLFAPWTQNVQSNGIVTALSPEHRPQTIHATIGGRIESWRVREGQAVKKGDTILVLSEVKTEYFDPNLVERVGEQIAQKSAAIENYGQKVVAADDQIRALLAEQTNKKGQLLAKIEQNRLKMEADRRDIEAAEVAAANAQKQAERGAELFQKGLNSKTQLENLTAKAQEAAAKLTASKNKFSASEQELAASELALLNNENEFAGKLAKAQSDRQSALADRADGSASIQKLNIDRTNYATRAGFYVIVAPQNGWVTKALRTGIGEIVKEGEAVVSIMPSGFELAVEMFVKPIDYPLLKLGKEVRFVFDGWPAMVFSGWPDLSFGTFQGRVVAIDNFVSEGGKFRVLVAPDPDARKWPGPLRPGGGARCIAMLGEVPLGYEFWRKLNGFPADFYEKPKTGTAEKPAKK